MVINKCKLCGSEFAAKFKTVKICEDCKTRPCSVCGRSFVREWPYDQLACSKECRKVLRNDPKRIAAREEKKRATLRERYGVDNVSQLSNVKEKISLSKKDPEFYAEMKAELAAAHPKPAPLIRQCVLCGKDFEAIGSQTTCKRAHYRTCVICGAQFEFNHIANAPKTCSTKCKAELRKRNLHKKELACAYCGKKFHSMSSTARYCPGPHYKQCEICGNEFEVDLSFGAGPSDLPRTCCPECAEKLRIQTSLERYGYEYATQAPEAREKARKQSIENAPQRAATVFARYGVMNVASASEIKEKIAKTVASEATQVRTRVTMRERYGVDYAMQSPEIARAHSTCYQQRASDGTRVDSKWEAMVYDFLLRNNINFEYNTVSIPFEYDGKQHKTHIDFKIGDLLLEVKGSHLLQGAYSNAPGVVPITKKLEVYRKHHVVLVTNDTCADMFGKPNSSESNGLKYLDKCPEPLIGINIELFDHPDFPYRNDRPPCFYDVKVDGDRSSAEAFFDESIRWNMILNRINYSGGFIDGAQVLTAMNVTRTCKQPSWFSKSLAKRIIKQYCSQDIIYDSFAGWGMRHDAAIELGRRYAGGDFNKDLVDWHNQKGRQIQYRDANEFTYDKKCSVFICPPYSAPSTGRCFEDYNFEGFDESAKALSQCDWLRIVINNVPNAAEYVMVCKIVDPEFEPFVVETLTNKSHLGTNNEYVIVVKSNDANKIKEAKKYDA